MSRRHLALYSKSWFYFQAFILSSLKTKEFQYHENIKKKIVFPATKSKSFININHNHLGAPHLSHIKFHSLLILKKYNKKINTRQQECGKKSREGVLYPVGQGNLITLPTTPDKEYRFVIFLLKMVWRT